jgi:hypothetical protein
MMALAILSGLCGGGSVAASRVSAAPYVSCPGGFIAKTYDKCPPVQIHRAPGSGGSGGPRGRGGDGGLLGGLLGGLDGPGGLL